MLSLSTYAGMLEDGLNAQLNDPDLSFRVWAYAGEEEVNTRIGNTVKKKIYCVLSLTDAANDATQIEMGTNVLTLTVCVPLKRPLTDVGGNSVNRYDRILLGQYPFLQDVSDAISAYFAVSKNIIYSDGGKTYSLGVNASIPTTGNVDIISQLGNCVVMNVGITMMYVEGGINSRAVKIAVDGEEIPYITFQPDADGVIEADVQAGGMRRKSYESATAVSFALTVPAVDNSFTGTAFKFLFDPVPNSAHFVTVNVGQTEYSYMMMISSPSAAAERVANVGITLNFIEIMDDAEIMDLPDGVQAGRFSFHDTSAASLSFTVSECLAYIGGECMHMNGETTVNLQPNDYIYDDETDTFYVYLFTLGKATVTADNFSVTKEAT